MMLTTRRILSLVFTVALAAAATVGALRAEDYSLITFAGAANNTSGADGTPGSFNNPYGVAIDAAKNIYVTDTVNYTVRKITPGRVVSTLAGTAKQPGTANGTGAAARFTFPVGIAVDGAGNVFVSDAASATIRKITPAGVVTTFAGAAFQIGSADGTGAAARFSLPYGLAIDGAGALYVADSGNNTIRKISADGVVTTLAGGAGQAGFTNGTGTAARFSTPFGVAVDGAGNVFVADSANHAIRKITAAGVVTTVAGGGPNAAGAIDAPGAAARFNQPRGVAVDGGGNLFVSDYANSTIRHITAGGVVSTVAGSPGIFGEVNSVGAAARLYEPIGILVDGTTVYVADTSNNQVRRGQPASSAPLPVISLHPLDQEVSVGQAVGFSVSATGSSLTYQWLRNNGIISGATNATYNIAATQNTDQAAYSVRVSSTGGAIDSNQATLTVLPVATGSINITARPVSINVNPGQAAVFTVAASGTGLTYQWFKNGGVISGATAASYTIASAQPGDAATYSVRLTSGTTTVTPTAKLTVGGATGSGISITAQPQGATRDVGQGVTFTVAASGTGTLTYQWLKDDNTISGATGTSYTINSVQAADAGNYSARVSNGSQNVLSASALLVINNPPPPGPTSRLANLSVRTTLAASQTLSVGFVMSGGSRNVLVRAAGPSLAGFGLPGAMVDPRLELFSGSTSVFTNDDWPANLAPTFASVGAFAFPANSKDAAFVQGLDGPRSVQCRGTGPGVVLVEAYDLGEGNSPRLINVSALNQVGTGDDILIAGFNLAGTGTKQLLVRAVGPTLADFGVAGTLADPILELYSGTTKIAENDNWAPALAPTFVSVGAFALTAGSRDAALVTNLSPGTYTVQVRGAANGTGQALIEVYEVP
ncbi:MAG: immunoglobulin domain-containing protein [Opitutaceae bacterium]|nr:immunoglobulin domain-containing protein [Opitutaceae bacterium]